MGKKKFIFDENQMSLFDLLDEETLKKPEVAVSMLFGEEYTVYPLKEWMERLLPQGKYYIMMGNHPSVLCETTEKILPEMKYRYYTIGDKIYAATGFGQDSDEDEQEDCPLED